MAEASIRLKSEGFLPEGDPKLGRSKSTVSRELRRNSKPTKQWSGGYTAERAHGLNDRRRRWDKRFKLARQPALRDHVRQRLAMGWSCLAGRPPPRLHQCLQLRPTAEDTARPHAQRIHLQMLDKRA